MPVPHICHVHSSFGCGGAQVRTATIMTRLGSRFRHSIMAIDKDFSAAGLIANTEVALVHPPPGKGNATYAWPLIGSLRQLKPDLLVTYNWGAMDAVMAGQIGRISPVVHTEDGFGPDEAIALKRRRVLIRRLALRRIFGTVVPSTTLRKIAIEQYALPEERIFFIPNGVDVNRFDGGDRRAARQRFDLPDSALVIGSVGALRPEKNLGLLIAAFARMSRPDAWLVIAGDGPAAAAARAAALTHGVEQRVRFCGHIADTPSLFAALDIFAMSSSTEQLPIALLEAMASRLPCLCTDVGDSAEALGTRVTPEIVRAGANVDEYRAALLELASNAGLRTAIGTKNRERCVQYYSVDHMVGQYAGVYEAAIASRSLRLNRSANAATI
jgi:L-malate glycosyltransferase